MPLWVGCAWASVRTTDKAKKGEPCGRPKIYVWVGGCYMSSHTHMIFELAFDERKKEERKYR